MLKYAAALLALTILSCAQQQGSTLQGEAGDVAREATALVATNATIDDRPLEDLVAKLDLAKTYGPRATDIIAGLRKTRAAVEKSASSAVTGGPRLASVTPVVGTFSFAQFAFNFGFVQEERTRKGGSISIPANPYSSSETVGETFTTTTLKVTETFTGDKSVVTATVRWSYSTITIDTSASGRGATLFHLTDDRDFEGKINVCPDATGGVPTTLKVWSNIVSEAGGVTTKEASRGNSEFLGSVNDQATLTSVTQKSDTDTSSTSAAGTGGHASKISATWTASSSGEILSGLQTGSIKAEIAATGIAKASEAVKAAGWNTALGAFAVQPAYAAAQELWKRGRCVVVAVPEYKAETPIETNEQQKVQRDEEVDPSSDTKFTVNLRHRFEGGTLNKPTTAELTSGKEKISPNKLDGGNGQLTYKADDEDDKEATAQLKSTSNRGIGTLVLKFHTSGKSLTLSVQGVQELGPTGATLRSNISIGPAKFQKKDDRTWEATAPFSATSVLVPPDEDCPDLKITQSGTLVFSATIETRGDDRFWVVRYGAGGSSKATGSGCDEDVTQSFAVGGGFGAGLFLGNVGDIVIPIDGGTVRLSGAQGTGRSSGTATATVTKKD